MNDHNISFEEELKKLLLNEKEEEKFSVKKKILESVTTLTTENHKEKSGLYFTSPNSPNTVKTKILW